MELQTAGDELTNSAQGKGRLTLTGRGGGRIMSVVRAGRRPRHDAPMPFAERWSFPREGRIFEHRAQNKPGNDPRARDPFSTERPQQLLRPALISQGAGLKLLVFSAGAVLMGLEIAGSRVLAPHFGNSVFVWGSLISVFLVALSLGYFFGGRLADRYPSHVLLSSICALVSLLIFALAAVANGLCGALLDVGLGERGGPLVASLLLFLPPSVGMGMVSPFAIRLATQSVASVGKISGNLYALSTAGSIAGTLLTTFVLIPLIGVSVILKGLGLVLLLASGLTLPFSKHARCQAPQCWG